MSELNIQMEGGTSVRLLTEGKYCDKNIVVTAKGGTENLDEVLTEQETLIATLQAALEGKTADGIAKYKQLLQSMIDRTITEIEDTEITTIGAYAFRMCSKLVTARFPKATSAGVCAFQQCSSLVNVEMPLLGAISNSAFYGTKVERLDFWRATSIDIQAFINTKLATLILRYPDGVCTLKNTSALNGTPIASGTGYVYVPAALVDSYKAATNWSTYAAQFRAIEDYPDICNTEVSA